MKSTYISTCALSRVPTAPIHLHIPYGIYNKHCTILIFLFSFQTPYYWPSQTHSDDSTDYAIYLTKRLSRNKQKHALEDYEVEAYNRLKKALAHKWDFITMQADEQVLYDGLPEKFVMPLYYHQATGIATRTRLDV